MANVEPASRVYAPLDQTATIDEQFAVITSQRENRILQIVCRRNDVQMTYIAID